MSRDKEREARARQRFIVLNALRFSGIALVLIGIALARGHIIPGLPWQVGGVIALAGLIDFFFAPPLIARAWRRQDEERR